jgi:hypothetical protein
MREKMRIDIDKITRPRWRQIAEALLRNDGDTAKTASELSLRRSYIYEVKYKLRQRGLMTGANRQGYISTMVRDQVLRMGHLLRHIRLYDTEFQEWVADQTPEGGAVCDTLLSIAYDVWLDEKEEKARKAA